MDDVEATELARALGHPLRLAYLRALRGRRCLSPSEFARDSDEPLGNVSYHVKGLFEAGVLEVAEMVPRRGAMEHRYALSSPRADVALAVMDLLAAA